MFIRIQAAVGSKKASRKKTIGNGFLFVRIKAAVGLKTVSEKKTTGNAFLFVRIKAAVGLKTFSKRNQVISHHITPHHGNSNMVTHFTSH